MWQLLLHSQVEQAPHRIHVVYLVHLAVYDLTVLLSTDTTNWFGVPTEWMPKVTHQVS